LMIFIRNFWWLEPRQLLIKRSHYQTFKNLVFFWQFLLFFLFFIRCEILFNQSAHLLFLRVWAFQDRYNTSLRSINLRNLIYYLYFLLQISLYLKFQ
jgi:hypothetical protein